MSRTPVLFCFVSFNREQDISKNSMSRIRLPPSDGTTVLPTPIPTFITISTEPGVGETQCHKDDNS